MAIARYLSPPASRTPWILLHTLVELSQSSPCGTPVCAPFHTYPFPPLVTPLEVYHDRRPDCSTSACGTLCCILRFFDQSIADEATDAAEEAAEATAEAEEEAAEATVETEEEAVEATAEATAEEEATEATAEATAEEEAAEAIAETEEEAAEATTEPAARVEP